MTAKRTWLFPVDSEDNEDAFVSYSVDKQTFYKHGAGLTVKISDGDKAVYFWVSDENGMEGFQTLVNELAAAAAAIRGAILIHDKKEKDEE